MVSVDGILFAVIVNLWKLYADICISEIAMNDYQYLYFKEGLGLRDFGLRMTIRY